MNNIKKSLVAIAMLTALSCTAKTDAGGNASDTSGLTAAEITKYENGIKAFHTLLGAVQDLDGGTVLTKALAMPAFTNRYEGTNKIAYKISDADGTATLTTQRAATDTASTNDALKAGATGDVQTNADNLILAQGVLDALTGATAAERLTLDTIVQIMVDLHSGKEVIFVKNAASITGADAAAIETSIDAVVTANATAAADDKVVIDTAATDGVGKTIGDFIAAVRKIDPAAITAATTAADVFVAATGKIKED